jgi:hypothetical protein
VVKSLVGDPAQSLASLESLARGLSARVIIGKVCVLLEESS